MIASKIEPTLTQWHSPKSKVLFLITHNATNIKKTVKELKKPELGES